MFRSKRSTYFSENRMGKFLQLALNRYHIFCGTVGYINDVERNTISTDPEQTINMVHTRVSSTFYTSKSNEDPPVLSKAGVTPDMSHLPPGIRKA